MSQYIIVKEYLKKGITLNDLNCDNCGSQLGVYESSYGKFIGCPNWKTNKGCIATKSVYGSPKALEKFGIKP